MGDGYDRFENEGGGGGSFVIGLLTGTVLGAGLGMLFAPKAGSELRGQLSEQAGNLKNQASEQYRRASEQASEWADRGRVLYDKARDAIARGSDEAQRYVREVTTTPPGTPSTATPGSTSYGTSPSYRSGSENVRGTGTDFSTGPDVTDRPRRS
jgi:gas vesicle protein